MAELPERLRHSFLPWEETEGSEEARIFRVWMPGVMGTEEGEENEPGWAELWVPKAQHELFRVYPHGWEGQSSAWQTLDRAAGQMEDLALAREWNELWALAQEAGR